MIEVEAESRGRTSRERFIDVAENLCDIPNAIRYAVRIDGLDKHVCRPPARDLIQIAVAVHLADRQIRRSLRSGHRPRRIIVTIPLEEPDRWEPQRHLLEDLAAFASQDTWTMAFRPALPKVDGAETEDKAVGSTVVALFSGGLDSLCGAAYLADRGDRVALLTHSPPGKAAVRSLFEPLPGRIGGRHPASYSALSIALRPQQRDRNGSRRFFQEFSRRTRPFFYLSLAAAAAIATGATRVQMSENGAFGTSLPIRRSHYGARMTRQGHSFLLNGFQNLLRKAVPEALVRQFENPFSAMTKGEACRHLRTAADLAQSTLSCEYVGQQVARLRRWAQDNHRGRGASTQFRQCGLCVPCLVRRAALRAADISDPDGDYFFDARKVLRAFRNGRSLFVGGAAPPLYEFAGGHCFYVARFAEELLSMKVDEFAIQYLPELSFLRPALIGSADLKKSFDLQRRFAREILEYLNG